MDLTILFAVIVYAAVVNLTSMYALRPVVSALMVVFMPLLLEAFLQYFLYTGNGGAALQKIKAADYLVASFQFVVAYIIFFYLRGENKSVAMWLMAAIVGALAIYVAVPYGVHEMLR